jgi:hypothetical protein
LHGRFGRVWKNHLTEWWGFAALLTTPTQPEKRWLTSVSWWAGLTQARTTSAVDEGYKDGGGIKGWSSSCTATVKACPQQGESEAGGPSSTGTAEGCSSVATLK